MRNRRSQGEVLHRSHHKWTFTRLTCLRTFGDLKVSSNDDTAQFRVKSAQQCHRTRSRKLDTQPKRRFIANKTYAKSCLFRELSQAPREMWRGGSMRDHFDVHRAFIFNWPLLLNKDLLTRISHMWLSGERALAVSPWKGEVGNKTADKCVMSAPTAATSTTSAAVAAAATTKAEYSMSASWALIGLNFKV